MLKLKGIFGKKLDKPDGTPEYGPLADHLHGVSNRAKKFCAKFGAAILGEISGLYHDAGKACDPFWQRLQGGAICDHATYGARFLYNKLKKSHLGKLFGFIICGHHGGLSNSLSSQHKTGDQHPSLHERLEEKDLPTIYPEAEKEFNNEYKKFEKKLKRVKLPEESFSKFLFTKMIYSSLVDADRLDSEKHGEKYKEHKKSLLRENYDSIQTLYKRFKKHIRTFSKNCQTSPVNIIRNRVQAECSQAAWSILKPKTWFSRDNFYSLTVPTGGGKTLSSMLFALKKAAYQKYDRIIYVNQYTTVLEQTADVFQPILGANNIIEHHCNFDKGKLSNRGELEQRFLAAENWDSPVIITTNVQFFESAFGNFSSRNRRLHNIVNSIIIFDEAHLLSPRYLKPCIRLMKELVESYHCSIVLCTATQPGLKKSDGFNWGLDKVQEIIKDPDFLYRSLERVNIVYKPNITTDSQLIRVLRQKKQILAIHNTRKHTLISYNGIKDLPNSYHLSTSMCAKHRRLKIAEIKNLIKNDTINNVTECRVASTQLVENGADLDFLNVLRNKGSVSANIQSGGRCNRNGKYPKGDLIITGVNHTFRDDFVSEAERISERYLRLKRNILDCKTARKAFTELYSNLEEKLDKPSGKVPILELIKSAKSMLIPFEEISHVFNLIESSTLSIIIPFNDEACDLIEKLREDPENFSLTRSLQQYTVGVWPKDYERLIHRYPLAIDDTVEPYLILMDESLYDNDIGLKIFNQKDLDKYVI